MGGTSSKTSAWSSIGSAASSGLSYASSVASSRSSLSGLLSEYDSTKKRFTTEYNSTMSDMGKAAKALKNADFNVAPEGATEEEIENNTKAVVSAVEDFAKKYNGTVSFLADNKDVSSRVSALGSSFGDTKYFAKSLSSVGITVKSSGELSVDTERLSKALKESPESAAYVLGKDGLAGRAEKKVLTAESQADRMFPTASAMMGSSVSSAQRMYSANTVNRASSYENVGTLLSMYF